MSTVQIEWGNLERSDAIEQYLLARSHKIFTLAPDATRLIVHLQIINAHHSTGVPTQKISLELRLPNHQDLRAECEHANLYQGIRDAKKALISQLNTRKKTQRARLKHQKQYISEPINMADAEI